VEFEANTEYKFFISYYIGGATTTSESSVVAAKESGSERPAFMDIEVLGPVAGREDLSEANYDHSLTGNE